MILRDIDERWDQETTRECTIVQDIIAKTGPAADMRIVVLWRVLVPRPLVAANTGAISGRIGAVESATILPRRVYRAALGGHAG